MQRGRGRLQTEHPSPWTWPGPLGDSPPCQHCLCFLSGQNSASSLVVTHSGSLGLGSAPAWLWGAGQASLQDPET